MNHQTNDLGIPLDSFSSEFALVAPSDVAALADAMLAAAKNPAETQAKADALRSYIQPLFSIEAMARTIAGAYREVAR